MVGGGVIGASVAYHLAARGVPDVVVLDAGAHPGAGSTARATGGFRVQFAAAIDVRLSLLSRAELRRFGEDTGGDCGYEPAGYLWLASNDAELAALRAALAVQRANGVDDAVEIDRTEIARLNPALRAGGVTGGTYARATASSARSDPRWVPACSGAEGRALRVGRACHRHRPRARRTYHCRAYRRDAFATGVVVNAAGAWAAGVARLAGVELPVTPLRRQVAVTVPTDVLPATMPMTIFARDGFHLRVRDGRVLLLLPSAGASDPFDVSVEPAWVDAVAHIARERVPCLRDVAIDRAACWAGLYEMSPDGHAIVGRAPGVPNLYFANGASGHGVMHAPALGALVAEIVADGAATSLDVTALRPERFASAEPHGARELL